MRTPTCDENHWTNGQPRFTLTYDTFSGSCSLSKKPTIQEEKIKRESRSVPEFLSAISDLQLLPLSSQIEET
ncbi:hypothetical protein MRB53_014893 [Persea americana]|uniref:Uncharacterized protein n=1 Tax=Persea americana TaxID=3435 RepID=A0ACC2KCK4_PERAE|nr:hypothetical protein MRB53_014893 [Persea americana]